MEHQIKKINGLFETNELYNKTLQNTNYLNNYLMDLRKTDIEKLPENLYNLYIPKIIPNVLSNDLCDYIIGESEKYAKNNKDENNDGWTISRHKSYPTTDLPVNAIPSLSNLIKSIVYYKIFPYIECYYKVNKYLLSLGDLFVVKYDSAKQKLLQKHKDGNLFSFNILLNDISNFEGGGTIFYNKDDTETIVQNTKGGLVIHSGLQFHAGNQITKGIRYILVGFIRYNFPNEHIPNPNAVLKIKPKKIILNNNNNLFLKSYNIECKTEKTFNSLLLFLNNRDKFIFSKGNKLKNVLLDLSKDKYNILEKYVYELFVFHLKNLNLEYDTNRFSVEYWIKNEEIDTFKKICQVCHQDKDEILFRNEKKIKFPILSTVTYLDEVNIPTVLTSTDLYFSDNKCINLKSGITLSFPKKNKHICFNGANYHAVYNLHDTYSNNETQKVKRRALMFNIWDNHQLPDIIANKIDNSINDIIYNKEDQLFSLHETPDKNKKNIIIDNLEMYRLVKNIINNTKEENTINTIKKYIADNSDIVYFDI